MQRASVCAAPVRPARRSGDHREEDQADDQHREDDLLALFGRGLGEDVEHGENLSHAAGVGRECAIDRGVADGGPRRGTRAARVATPAERAARLVEPCPRSAAVAAQSGPSPPAPSARSCEQSEISSERSATASTSPKRGDADEPVRVEVVAEEQRRVAVRRGEQARRPVVDEVALVDRLEPEREPLVAERREDRLELARSARSASLPERAPPRPRPRSSSSPRGQRPKKSPTASTVRSMSSSECASETNIASNCDGAR